MFSYVGGSYVILSYGQLLEAIQLPCFMCDDSAPMEGEESS